MDSIKTFKSYYIEMKEKIDEALNHFNESLTEDNPLLDQIRYSNFFEKNITRKDLHGTRQRLIKKARHRGN